jgi:hypothetical protein
MLKKILLLNIITCINIKNGRKLQKKNIITNIIIIITIIVKKYFLKKILVWAPSVWLDAQPLRLGTLGA